MGSFNTTCFASQQTISSGNDCYVIAIKQESGFNPVECLDRQGNKVMATSVTGSTCYPCAFWNPIGQFIKATYNDYGQVIIEDTIENKNKVQDMFRELSRICYTTIKGENPYHDPAFDIATLKDNGKPLQENWDYMWDAAVTEFRLFVQGYQDNAPRQFTFAIISQQAYDYLIGLVDDMKRYDKKSNHRRAKIADFITEMQQDIADANELATIETAITNKKSRYSAFAIRHHLERLLDEGSMEGMRSIHHPDLDKFVDELLTTKTFSTETTNEIMKRMEQGRVFGGLNFLNIKITPMVYSSQDYSNEIGRAYFKFVRDVSSQISAQQKKAYDE